MNIEFMQELEMLKNKKVKPKRSYRSIQWLLQELETAINEDIVMLKKCIHFEDDNRAYKLAKRLEPALDIIQNDQVREVIKTILKEANDGNTGTDSAVRSQNQIENRTVRKNRSKKRN